MPISADILEAKQSMSSRLLRPGQRVRGAAMARTRNVSAVVANAGRNIHAVGVGYKIVSGKVTKTDCVRLYVIRKISPSLLSPRDRLPEQLDGIPTDVIESPIPFLSANSGKKTARKKIARKKTARKKTAKRSMKAGTKKSRKMLPGRRGGIRAMATLSDSCSINRQSNQRPVVAGISASNHDVMDGTIACFCRSTRAGDNPATVYALSNNHVFADLNHGIEGDNLYQPAPGDGGTNADHFAELSRFVPLNLSASGQNLVDAALGQLLPGVSFDLEVCGVGRITEVEQVTNQMAVRKHGRTTGYTEGIVTDPSYDGGVALDVSDPFGVTLFQNQIRIESTTPGEPFGGGGDSGSLVIHRTRSKAVGLYFANTVDGSFSLANNIIDVLSELEIELL